MKPNIVLITTDQQRFDTLSCNGSSFLHTPNLDRLAESGARFTRAYCTNPVCTPSRVSIMTGKYPSAHGSYNIGTVAEDTGQFLSSRLAAAGYRTHHIGKAHFYPSDRESKERFPVSGSGQAKDFAGFETAEFLTGYNDWGVTMHYREWLKEKGIDSTDYPVHILTSRDAYANGDWELPEAVHNSAWIVDRTRKFLKSCGQIREEEEGMAEQRPFFLNIGFQDPHHPHLLPIDFDGRIPLEDVSMPHGTYDSRVRHLDLLAKGKIVESHYAGRYQIAGNQNTRWDEYFADEEKTRTLRRQYYSMIRLLDRRIGEILDAISEKGLTDNTIVVFTTDHGDMLGDHGLGQKGPMSYEEVVHVPLIISWPGMIEPQAAQGVTSLADLYPTLLSFAGIAPDGADLDLDGIAMNDMLFSRNREHRDHAVIQFKEEADAVRYQCIVTKEWKLTEYIGEDYGELYHLSADPGEDVNLYFDEKYDGVKYRLLRLLVSDLDAEGRRNERPCRC